VAQVPESVKLKLLQPSIVLVRRIVAIGNGRGLGFSGAKPLIVRSRTENPLIFWAPQIHQTSTGGKIISFP